MKPAETKPDNTAVGDVKSIKPGLRFWFWLKDPLCWALLILCGLVFGMTSLQRFFTALFPELDRPIYLQDTFFSLVVAHVLLVLASSSIAVFIGVTTGLQ